MSTKLNLEVIENTAYGTHTCACGCGKLLDGTVFGIGLTEDEEGYEWRMFTPKCWENIKANYDITSQHDLILIYTSYSASEEV